MKHGSNSRRGRSRGNGKRHSSPRNQTFDSNGPEGKVRGTPQQILDKYLSLARDAASAGEHIAAEGFYQFAEHYFRILNADQQHRQRMAEAQQQAEDTEEDDASGDGQEGGSADDGQDASTQGGDNEKPRKTRGNGRRRNGGEAKGTDASAEPDSGDGGASDAGDASAADGSQSEESDHASTESVSPA